VRRATIADAEQISAIVNDPGIRAYIGGDGESHYDPTPLLEDENSFLLFDEGGGQFFDFKGPGIFEAHSFYLVRGKEALSRGREAVALMFDEYGAEMIWRATPLDNKRARWFNRQLGFRSLGEISLPIHGHCELFEMRGTPCH
jgi:hypothetical protein